MPKLKNSNQNSFSPRMNPSPPVPVATVMIDSVCAKIRTLQLMSAALQNVEFMLYVTAVCRETLHSTARCGHVLGASITAFQPHAHTLHLCWKYLPVSSDSMYFTFI